MNKHVAVKAFSENCGNKKKASVLTVYWKLSCLTSLFKTTDYDLAIFAKFDCTCAFQNGDYVD